MPHFLLFSGLSGGVVSEVADPDDDCLLVRLRGLPGLMLLELEAVEVVLDDAVRSVWVLIPWTSLEGVFSSPVKKDNAQ